MLRGLGVEFNFILNLFKNTDFFLRFVKRIAKYLILVSSSKERVETQDL